MYESTVLNEDWMADGDVYDDSIDNGVSCHIGTKGHIYHMFFNYIG